jgi:hypothetical protein
VRQPIIVPLILSIVVLGAYQGSRQWGDIYTLVAFGVLGWVMKRLKWPRPPLILGFVLGGIIERFMFISTMRYGWEWVTRPVVMVVLALAVLSFVGPLWREWRAFRHTSANWRDWASPRFDVGTVFYVGLLALLALMYAQSLTWGTDQARLVPTLVMYFVIGAVAVSTLHYVFAAEQVAGAHPTRDALRVDLDADFGELTFATVARRALAAGGWIVALLAMIWLIGMLPAVFVFILAYMRIEGREPWWLTVTVSAAMTVACYVLFDQLLRIVWPQTVLGHAVPALRALVPSL